jgi:hypothetical protein
LVLCASLLDSSFLNKYRKAYRVVSWTLPPTNFPGAHESDRETSSDHYFLIKTKMHHLQPEFRDTLIPSNWRTVFFSDYAVLWSFILGGWLFLLLSTAVIIFLAFHLFRLILISLHVFKINKEQVFYFPETKSKVLVFLLGLTLIQFIYPFLSNFMCLSLTGQSVPLLSASKVEVFFLIILISSLHYVYNLKNYYFPLTAVSKGQSLRSYSRLSKYLTGIISLMALIFIAVVGVRGSMINKISSDMTWPIYYEDDLAGIKDTINPAGYKTSLIAKAQTLLCGDLYVAVPRIKTEYLKNLASIYYCGKPYRKIFYRQKEFHNSEDAIQRKISLDSAACIKKTLVSGYSEAHEYSIRKFNNGKLITVVSNKLISGYPIDSRTVNVQLQIELNKALELFVDKTGKGNTGSIIVAENTTGNLLSTASYPFLFNSNPTSVDRFNSNNPHKIRLISDGSITNTADSYLLPGSLVKPIVAYSALKNLENAEDFNVNGCGFIEFLKSSDDAYSAELFKKLMLTPVALDGVLSSDFNLNLYSPNEDAFIDEWPRANDFSRKLDRLNPLYRLSIGQQQTFSFRKVFEIYCRIASGTKTKLSYTPNSMRFESLSLNPKKIGILHEAMHGALYGTANSVRLALEKHGINYDTFICKTGTAQKKGSKSNSTSSFIICTGRFAVGIQLAGDIPENTAGLSAKNLFITLIPLLREMGVL